MKLLTRTESEYEKSGLSSARRVNSADRSGVTLLEVLLATAIFMGSLTAILQVMRVGHDSRLSAKLDSEAALRCESLLGELVAGITPLTSESNQPFTDSENWRYSVTVEEGPGDSLLLVSVRVEHVIAEQLPNSTFTLVRLMRDPQLFLDAAMAAEEAEAEE
jgi:general secretion pathway protein I